MPLTHNAIAQGYESPPEGVGQDRFTQGKMSCCCSLFSHHNMKVHGDLWITPEPIEAGAPNHSDHTFDDLGNFRKFLRDSRDEAELAVYLGLRHKHDLRHFALSWPIIKTWLRAPHKQTISLKVEINHLIQDGKEISCIEDPYQVWPERPWESEENTSVRITHIMAWHLVQMSKDIEEYTMSSDLHNFHRTRRYRGELSAMLEFDIPLDNIFHPRPQLTSWRNELSDRFDRCWTILGYVSWIPYMESWEKALGFFVSSKNKAIIYDSGMPTGTIPRPNGLRLAQQCSSSRLAEGPKGPAPIQVRVIWDRDQNVHGNMNLCGVLAGIAHEGKVLPPTDQIMTQDPRACNTGASFRDIIRHMMSCGGYGLNLCDMMLSYHVETDNFYYQIDAFRSQWKVLQGVFSDPANSNFVIRVLLDVHDFGNGEVYETTELPPVYRETHHDANHTSTCSG
ncbi:unnamed protein product [Penicillium nalgiovense]|uniref:Uncharacterized protein n=1 Tax=Penicillium nalgiovense TaxID=60175 RepID=A0A9W4HDL7_PENNA|nr:unnamed protein product [Penicillium nalgiovense]CAG7950734.1 unnamed protein product [Penicillium nalgiovense]CAG7979301.1 unnamed protein product [Penicillium nalgiovense]CAG8002974.1 unnamed protein product [Penicillium nalgiovense]CAG8012352.1 unnamed protein product [Penicillium nalgiovense]